jgi:hypothetical protein
VRRLHVLSWPLHIYTWIFHSHLRMYMCKTKLLTFHQLVLMATSKSFLVLLSLPPSSFLPLSVPTPHKQSVNKTCPLYLYNSPRIWPLPALVLNPHSHKWSSPNESSYPQGPHLFCVKAKCTLLSPSFSGLSFLLPEAPLFQVLVPRPVSGTLPTREQRKHCPLFCRLLVLDIYWSITCFHFCSNVTSVKMVTQALS